GESTFTVARQSLAELRDRDVLVVSSLGDPTLFLDQVRGAGARAELLAYPDHHDFSDADTATIMARASGRPIVITRKEAVKLRGRPLNMEVLVVHQTVTMEQGEDELHQALGRALGGKG